MKNNGLIWTLALWLVMLLLAGYQVFDYVQFRTAGERYTKQEGYALCQRVQKLDGLGCE